MVADVGSTGIQLDWLGKGTKKIQERKELQLQLEKVVGLKVQVKKVDLLLNQSYNLLKQAQGKAG